MSPGSQPGDTSFESMTPLEISRIGRLDFGSSTIRRVPGHVLLALYALAIVTRSGSAGSGISVELHRMMAAHTNLAPYLTPGCLHPVL